MKRAALTAGLGLGLLLAVRGEGILLHPGQTFTYEFNSLPLVVEHIPDPWVYCTWSYDRGSLVEGDTCSWRFWGPSGDIYGMTISLTEAPPDWQPGLGQPIYFDEVRGGIEISYGPQSGGILRIGSIDIQISAPAPAGGYSLYAITLVPEPQTAVLGVLGASVAVVLRRWQRPASAVIAT
jgi:hypothetical protein